jgi:hypothetical protein
MESHESRTGFRCCQKKRSSEDSLAAPAESAWVFPPIHLSCGLADDAGRQVQLRPASLYIQRVLNSDLKLQFSYVRYLEVAEPETQLRPEPIGSG